MSFNSKHMTDAHLLNAISYERRRVNTGKLRIQACQNELIKRGYGELDVGPLSSQDPIEQPNGRMGIMESLGR